MWVNIVIPADSTHADALTEALMDQGALSASMEDAHAGTDQEQPQFGEPGMPGMPLWDQSRVIALFEAGSVTAEQISAACVAAGLPADTPYIEQAVAEQNWVQLTQSQFAPIQITDRLWIVPSWHEAPNPNAINMVLDPGMAFGTGSHPTTHLCLAWLCDHVQGGERLMDYGCGSGILAIAAAMLGAGEVSGTDIDPHALVAAEHNAAQNGVTLKLFDTQHAINGHFDVVVANILANPLTVLAPALISLARPGGLIALSGILCEQVEQVQQAYAPAFDLTVSAERDGWVLLTGTRIC